MKSAFSLMILLCLAGNASGQEFDAKLMTPDRLGEIVLRIDENAISEGPAWFFSIEDLDAILIYDTDADRMRVMIPINESEDLSPEELMRLMQANFDSALDARYAIANGVLWGVFIHQLSSLSDEEFLLGIGQTANVVVTFGNGYSSGMFIFGGGDSEELERKRLLDNLKELLEETT